MTAVTGGIEKSRLWASSRIGSDALKARWGDPGLRCRQTTDAHARPSRGAEVRRKVPVRLVVVSREGPTASTGLPAYVPSSPRTWA